MRRPGRILSILVLLAAASFLSACAAAILDTAAQQIFKSHDVNLIERDYAAADYLAGQAKNFVSRDDLIGAEVLAEVHRPDLSSEIGRMIPEQIGTRLSQLGYRVDLRNVKTAEGGDALGPPPGTRPPKFMLSGNYVRGKTLDVSLHITEIRTGQVVAAFDYSLNMNSKIRKLSEPRARIFRVSP